MLAIGPAMTELLTIPPPPEAIHSMLQIPRTQIAPTILATQQGPDGHLGPEAAGAILMLQATFADADGATDEKRSCDGRLNDDPSHTSGEYKQRFSNSFREENENECDGEDDACPGVNECSTAEHEDGARDGAGGAGRHTVDDSA